jgi:hypothetical protein
MTSSFVQSINARDAEPARAGDPFLLDRQLAREAVNRQPDRIAPHSAS